jgi:hypothetical protein
MLRSLGGFFPGDRAKVQGSANASTRVPPQLARAGEDRPTFLPYVGFALSDDGCWRVHSWVQTPGGIVETTVKRRLYFGIPMGSSHSRKPVTLAR